MTRYWCWQPSLGSERDGFCVEARNAADAAEAAAEHGDYDEPGDSCTIWFVRAEGAINITEVQVEREYTPSYYALEIDATLKGRDPPMWCVCGHPVDDHEPQAQQCSWYKCNCTVVAHRPGFPSGPVNRRNA